MRRRRLVARIRAVCRPLAVCVVAWVTPAWAQPVDCSTLVGAYCFSDTCFLPGLEVASPCVVDFGARVLEIEGTLRIPVGGVVSFKATRISVDAPIKGGDGAQLTLEAAPNQVSVNKPISVPGGAITLKGRSVAAFVPVKAKTQPGHPPGTLAVEATGSPGLIQFTKPIRVNGRRASTDGGTVVLRADGEVHFDAVDVSGLHGGTVEITSNGNTVDCFHQGCRIHARGGSAGAGTIRVTGANVVLSPVKLQADELGGGGGDIHLRATTSQVFINGVVDVRGGGTFEAASPSILSTRGSIRTAPGGCIGLSAPTIDTTGTTFDTTPVADCPGSPGGAFLDCPLLFGDEDAPLLQRQDRRPE